MPTATISETAVFQDLAGMLKKVLTTIRATKDPNAVVATVQKIMEELDEIPKASRNSVTITMELRVRLSEFLDKITTGKPSYQAMIAEFSKVAILLLERVSRATKDQSVTSAFSTIAQTAAQEVVRSAA